MSKEGSLVDSIADMVVNNLLTNRTSGVVPFADNTAGHERNSMGLSGFGPLTSTAQGIGGRTLTPQDKSTLLQKFKLFLEVDKHLAPETVYERLRDTRHYIDHVETTKSELFSSDTVRNYLSLFKGKSVYLYVNRLKPLKLLYRYLGREDIVVTFKFPRPNFKPKNIPTRLQLAKFYSFLPNSKFRALFLFYASTGLRLMEVLSLRMGDVNFDTRMVTPTGHIGQSKQSYISFFNRECEEELLKYLGQRGANDAADSKLFCANYTNVHKMFRKASVRSGVKVTPKRLREWFCSEMGELGVPDRYVDAYCGRVPGSVLARHYTDYKPEKLKIIYEKANLQVLR